MAKKSRHMTQGQVYDTSKVEMTVPSRHIDSCVPIIGELKKTARTEVDSSRRLAWAFTRLSSLGYPQYLE